MSTIDLGPPCRTCGTPVLPFSLQADASHDAPEVWSWTCPGQCPRVDVLVGRPGLAAMEAADLAFAPFPATVLVSTDQPHDEDISAGDLGPAIYPGRSCPSCGIRHRADDDMVLACYDVQLGRRFGKVPGLRARLLGLRGRVLACDCLRRPSQSRCHGLALIAFCNLWAHPRPAWIEQLARARRRRARARA